VQSLVLRREKLDRKGGRKRGGVKLISWQNQIRRGNRGTTEKRKDEGVSLGGAFQPGEKHEGNTPTLEGVESKGAWVDVDKSG